MSVTQFDIADVARIHGVEILDDKKNGTVFAVCPFCGDKRGKFTYVTQKGSKSNMYNCYACGVHGGVLDLHMKLSEKQFLGANAKKEAAKDIFSILNGDEVLQERHARDIESRDVAEEVQKTSQEMCEKVYYAMLKLLPLKDEHKKDLIRRGLTEEQITYFHFASTPANKYALIKELLIMGLSLDGVPGFYKNKRNNWDMYIPAPGYFCPAYDGNHNKIVGLQIRLDEPIGSSKYLWFSSSGKTKGVSSGAFATYLPGKTDRTCIIVEGILKACLTYSMLKGQITVLGVPGVKVIDSIKPYFRGMKDTVIFEAYDMDKAVESEDEHERKKSEDIANDAWKLRELAFTYGLPIRPLIWDFKSNKLWKGQYKGIDDFLLEYKDRDTFISHLIKKSEETKKVFQFLS